MYRLTVTTPLTCPWNLGNQLDSELQCSRYRYTDQRQQNSYSRSHSRASSNPNSRSRASWLARERERELTRGHHHTICSCSHSRASNSRASCSRASQDTIDSRVSFKSLRDLRSTTQITLARASASRHQRYNTRVYVFGGVKLQTGYEQVSCSFGNLLTKWCVIDSVSISIKSVLVDVSVEERVAICIALTICVQLAIDATLAIGVTLTICVELAIDATLAIGVTLTKCVIK